MHTTHPTKTSITITTVLYSYICGIVFLLCSSLLTPNTHELFWLWFTFAPQQIPRYIITLHELLAHTPHEHVERKSLEFAKSKLEDLSR